MNNLGYCYSVEQLIDRALEEDVGTGDITTLTTISEDAIGHGKYIAKEDGVLCGVDLARRVYEKLDDKIEFTAYKKDGDEVGMTGGKDPDCRRGMLWDRSRWDMATWDHYRRLLRIRKEYPALTQGKLVRQDAWDDLSLVRITRELNGQKITVLFHASHGSVHLPELAGRLDLLTGTPFDGVLTDFRALMLLSE